MHQILNTRIIWVYCQFFYTQRLCSFLLMTSVIPLFVLKMVQTRVSQFFKRKEGAQVKRKQISIVLFFLKKKKSSSIF